MNRKKIVFVVVQSILVLIGWCMMKSDLHAQRLVLPGDHPDPTVVKIDDTYWSSTTTSNWFPAYPLYKSSDLINWELTGHVFDTIPSWADYYFWAPEMVHENGKTYVYYTAHQRDGNLCVAVASADNPAGPYKDHGPIVCQAVGSIDAFEYRDSDGKLYLIWKEDGNSVGEPTPNWIQEINEERTELLGEKKELFRNDQAWERNLVEGIAIMRYGDYLYAFYAGAGCCGASCTYKGGIARAKNILGPWEKYEDNPILVDTEEWVCPGHGTPVKKDGRYYFMYHSYNAESRNLVGRQGMLIEFEFTPDGWIRFIYDESKENIAPPVEIVDRFSEKNLSPIWHWSIFQNFDRTMKNGRLHMQALPEVSGAFIGRAIYQLDFDAEVTFFPKISSASGGISIIGDEKNLIYALAGKDEIKVISVKDGVESVLQTLPYSSKKEIRLKMEIRNGKEVRFYAEGVKGDNNEKKEGLSPLNTTPADAVSLPPWDRSLRVGLVSRGNENEEAVFDDFKLINISKNGNG